MNLANPSIGTILDRLSILSLKILHGTEAGKDVSHFVAEREQLLDRQLGQPRVRVAVGLDLAVVNAALWQAEDEMRRYREVLTLPEPVAQCGRRIQSLNDRRAALIAQIDAEAGEPSAPEKL